MNGASKILTRGWWLSWLVIAACDSGGPPASPAGAAPEPQRGASSATLQAQVAPRPCDWVPLADVEEILGPLAGPPYLTWTATDRDPDAHGSACYYPVAGPRGDILIGLEVDLTGALAEEHGFHMGIGHGLRVAREQELDDETADLFAAMLEDLTRAPGAEPVPGPADADWDFSRGLPGIAVWRIGHVAVKLGGDTMLVPGEKLAQLALRVRERLSDALPFRATEHDDAYGLARDPCSLLNQPEAEAVLGELVVAPYRSSDESPLQSPTGRSCTYLARSHRALVLTPEFSDGEMIFGFAAGLGGKIRSTVGGADHGDLLDGPWDQATEGSDAVYFLAGDRLLKMSYRASSAGLADAARLAEIAVPRLAAPQAK
jgi:hypothetical protein